MKFVLMTAELIGRLSIGQKGAAKTRDECLQLILAIVQNKKDWVILKETHKQNHHG